MKVLFIKSPTGQFNLAYSADDVAELPKKLAENLIADGFALDYVALEKERKAAEKAAKKEVSELEALKLRVQELEEENAMLMAELQAEETAPKTKPAPKTKN